jgi:O-methyltransferase involved in polyketide biosynthesis
LTAGVPAVSLRAEGRPDPTTRATPHLGGVPETMLWTLYDRACEARRADRILVDADSVRICDAIDYDFEGRFGHPSGSFAARAAGIDHLLRRWLERHPDGLVVSLGEGLEARAHRVDNGRVRWLTVDLPAAIQLREYFLPSTRRFSHVAANVLELDWMNKIEPSSEIFIVAQGLFMYLKSEAVKQLFVDIATRFPVAEMAFDVIPRWFSRLTLWGGNANAVLLAATDPLGHQSQRDRTVPTQLDLEHHRRKFTRLRIPHGWPKVLEDLYRSFPIAYNELPCIVHAVMGDAGSRGTPC